MKQELSDHAAWVAYSHPNEDVAEMVQAKNNPRKEHFQYHSQASEPKAMTNIPKIALHNCSLLLQVALRSCPNKVKCFSQQVRHPVMQVLLRGITAFIDLIAFVKAAGKAAQAAITIAYRAHPGVVLPFTLALHPLNLLGAGCAVRMAVSTWILCAGPSIASRILRLRGIAFQDRRSKCWSNVYSCGCLSLALPSLSVLMPHPPRAYAIPEEFL
eukprot:scaffold2637_cov421-Pavlova_lutheri.AAC.4